MIPFLSGGGYRRPGSLYAHQSYSGSTDFAPRVIPFVFSKSETYAVIIGQTLAGSSYVDILNPYSNTANPSDATVTGALPYSGKVFAGYSATGSYYDDWSEAQYVQSADILYLVHPLYKPYRIERTAANAFSVLAFDNGLSGATLRDAYPYRPKNTTASWTMAPSHTSGSGRTLTSHDPIFDTGHIGAIFKINHSGTIGACKVTAVALGGLTATVDIIVDFAATTAVADWWESAWSDYRGWPRTVAFYQQRLAYGGNESNPDSIWHSEESNYDVLSVAATADPRSDGSGDDPFTIELSSQQLNLIQWMSAEKTLLVGTQGDEWIIDFNPTTTVPGFATETATAVVQSHYGSAYTPAVRLGNELIFCSSGEDELRSLVFNDIEKSYVDEPIQTFYDEFPRTEPTSANSSTFGNRKVKSFGWDETRKTLWAIDTAGNFVGMTRDRRASVTLWHSHRMGGFNAERVGSSIDIGGSNFTTDPAYIVCAGSVVSLTIIPNQIIGTNDIWLVVKRYINGAWAYHVERIIGKVYPFESAYIIPPPEGSYLTDASVYVANSRAFPTIVDGVFSDLDHLEGETPVGTAYNTRGIFKVSGSAVSSGDTTIEDAERTGIEDEITTAVIMGLSYAPMIKPVRLEAGSQIGNSQGAIKRIDKVTVRFYRTLSAQVGPNEDDLESIDFRDGDTPMQNTPELFTGDKQISIESDYDTDGYLCITQEDPLPFAVASIIAEGMTYDG